MDDGEFDAKLMMFFGDKILYLCRIVAKNEECGKKFSFNLLVDDKLFSLFLGSEEN